MVNFLEELYYGNINPQARWYHKDIPTVKATDSTNELEEKLTERLSGDEKKLFLDFCNAYAEMMGTSNLDSFIAGFRLGAKMTLDTFCSDDVPLERSLKD